MNNRKIHILRYGTVADSEYIRKAINSYDYLAINGNTAAYVSSAIAKFIVNNFFSNNNKGFFIDPLTYAFQDKLEKIYADNKKEEKVIKKSISKLINEYKEPINCVNNGVTVKVNDFSDERLCKEFCERVLNFQNNLVSNYVNENNLSEYIEFIKKKSVGPLKPKFLIAPYFYLDNNDTQILDWLETNIKLFNISAEICKNKKAELFCQITIDKNILCNEELINRIGKEYSNIECSGYTIWINGLKEQAASLNDLNGYIKLLEHFKGKQVFDMYGGYFSILLLNEDVSLLSGVSHGLEYGESREVYPVGGGIPTPKYYYKPIHQRIDFTKAFYLLEHKKVINPFLENLGSSDLYYKEICDCNRCKSLLGDTMQNFVQYECDDFFEVKNRNSIIRRKKATKETKENCLFHYLLCKKAEFDDINNKKISILLSDLEKQYSNYKNCNNILNGELDYMIYWKKAIENYVENEKK